MNRFTLRERTELREETIHNLLIELGLPQNLAGSTYIHEILLNVDPSAYGCHIVLSQLYLPLYEKFGVNYYRVERTIRYAINYSFTYGNQQLQDEIFAYTISADKGRPTIKEFLAMLVNLLRVDERELKN